MGRIEAQKKMGYYPTPQKTLQCIKQWLHFSSPCSVLDPCCGEGDALYEITRGTASRAYGIEIDTHRAEAARAKLHYVLQCSIYDVIIRPAAQFSLLYLNPPYEYEDGERMEVRFLRHCLKWLKPDGILVFLIKEQVLGQTAHLLRAHFQDLVMVRVAAEDYPQFNQVVVFGVKAVEGDSDIRIIHNYIDRVSPFCYQVPSSIPPGVFEKRELTIADIKKLQNETLARVKSMILPTIQVEKVYSPLFPLRKGHLVALIMSGILDGEIKTEKDHIVYKSFSSRETITREEGDKIIEIDRYASGIRILDLCNRRWFDVK